ncbi:hypothetical protein [Xanthomonas translucens]|uniref:hypothetical protein n=1 Tax=Xanthomonas campestris pv. translucens TaxID=343 RepID=UPI0012D7458A|nr:hypothetical protein [Xanthomonas translucens]
MQVGDEQGGHAGIVEAGLGTRDSGLGTRDSGLGTRDSGLGIFPCLQQCCVFFRRGFSPDALPVRRRG